MAGPRGKQLSGAGFDTQINWSASLGAITHLKGPSDQPFKIEPGTGQDIQIGATGRTVTFVSGGTVDLTGNTVTGLSPSFLNVGTATDATAIGDFAAGVVGGVRVTYDQSAGAISLLSGANAVRGFWQSGTDTSFGMNDATPVTRILGTVNGAGASFEMFDGGAALTVALNAVGYGRIGTLTDPVALGDFGAGITAAGRMFYDQSNTALQLYDAGGTLQHSLTGTGLGLFTTAPIAQVTVTGAKAGNAALTDLLTKLASYGLLVDSTT